MATIGNSFLGIIDHYKRTGRNGQALPIIESLHQLNPFLQDAYAVECNNGTKHTSLIRTGLGQSSWTKLYEGIVQSKSTTQQVDDTTGMIERLATIDTRYLTIVKNAAAERATEADAALEQMSQDVQQNIFYSDDATTPERFKGLAARYKSIANGGAAGGQIVDGGGTGSDNTSIWFVTHGPRQTQVLYPEGTAAGIQREDMGRQRVLDDQGRPYYVKEEHFAQQIGIAVGDWRYNARIANIDVSDMLAGSVDIYDLMRRAYWKLHGRRAGKIENTSGGVPQGRTVIYANRDVLQALDGLATNNGAGDNFVRLTPDEVAGKEVLTYRGMPIRETDALINAEARVI